MSRLDRVLAAGTRQRALEEEEARTGTDVPGDSSEGLAAGVRQLHLEAPDWDKFGETEGPWWRLMGSGELAAYTAMAHRVADVLRWYAEGRSDKYGEEIAFLNRVVHLGNLPERYPPEVDEAYTMQTVHSMANLLQQTIGAPRTTDGTLKQAYLAALRRLKTFFDQTVAGQNGPGNDAIRANHGQYREQMRRLADYWTARNAGTNPENANEQDRADAMDFFRGHYGLPGPNQ